MTEAPESSVPPEHSALPAAGSAEPTPAPPSAGHQPTARRWGWSSGWPWLGLLVLGLMCWAGWVGYTTLTTLRTEVAERLARSDARVEDLRAAQQNAEARLAAAESKLGLMEGRLAEAQSQQQALDQLYQELARSSDERALAELEQLFMVAQQQLQLAGNSAAALIALQTMDARLARLDRPRFLALRRALVGDIDRLRTAAQVDWGGLALRLDNLLSAVDNLSLAYGAPAPGGGSRPAAGATRRFAAWLTEDLWQDLRELVRIERLDRPDPALLAPEHAFFLRENLRLRLLHARTNLLQRDGRAFREDLRQAVVWVERYFDGNAPGGRKLLSQLRDLGKTDLSTEQPSLADTASALKALRAQRDRLGPDRS
ncbi:MAG: hypothetical protein AMXMBFR6_12140 [Betaproteobacteria bacterium]|nr:uroporphyrinogen-III C-methyltransferase [Rhodocyclaceae bacterium]MCG3185550.1 hypothetical protein [Rhodocyclaceae bacterium]